jgi:hypothetical protein
MKGIIQKEPRNRLDDEGVMATERGKEGTE